MVPIELARLHVMPWVAGPIHAPLVVLNVGKKATFHVLKQLYYASTYAHYSNQNVDYINKLKQQNTHG